MFQATAYNINSTFFLAQIFTIIGLYIRGDKSNALEALIILGLYFLFLYLEKIRNFKIENWIRLILLITLLANSLGGHLLSGYDLNYFDQILHFVGSFSFASFSFSVINKLFHLKYSSQAVMFIFINALGLSIGTLYEILEFYLDYWFNMNNQLGLLDTDSDLIADTLGSLASATYILYISQMGKALIKNN